MLVLGDSKQLKRRLTLAAVCAATLSVGAPATAADPDPAAGADVAVWKIGPGSAEPGAEISWAITAASFDGQTVSDAVVSDNVPAGVTVTAAPGCQVTSPAGGALPLAGPLTLTCPVGELVVDGPDVEVTTVTAQVADGFTGVLTNSATIASPTVPEIDASDNTHSWRTAVGGTALDSADLAVWKSGPDEATAGDRIIWKLEAVNYAADGASVTATDAVVTDQIPRGVTVTAAPGCSVADPMNGFLPMAGPFELACAAPELVPGDDSDWVTVSTITATISRDFSGVLTNSASIASPTLNELEHTDNLSHWSITVTAAPAPAPSPSPTPPQNRPRPTPTAPTRPGAATPQSPSATRHPVTG